MNYFFGKACVSFFANRTLSKDFEHPDYALKEIDARGFARQVEHFLGLYDWQINLAQLNLLDSHDTPRALHLMGERVDALQLSVLMQMTMPGAPCIYYGSEIGMTGAGDPHCREAFPWDEPETWNQDLLAFYRRAVALRHTHEVLRTGDFHCLAAEGEQIAFRRRIDGSEAIVAFNAGDEDADLVLPGEHLQAEAYYRVWPENNGRVLALEGDRPELRLPAREAVVLVNQRG
jgi:neopullulanase